MNQQPLYTRGTVTGNLSIRESVRKPLRPPLLDSHGKSIVVNNPYSSTSVPNRILGQMLWSAFRHALGRESYIVGETVKWMEMYWPCLDRWHKQIHERIREAIATGRAGWEGDGKEWQKVLTLPANPDSRK